MNESGTLPTLNPCTHYPSSYLIAMPNQQYLYQAKKVSMYYDPRGQVVRTVNPDSSEQWVIFGKPTDITAVSINELGLPMPFAEGQNSPPLWGGVGGGVTPWESFTYDSNDLATVTHQGGTGVHHSHHHTPKSSLLDPLGRTIKTIDRNGTTQADEVEMRYEYDIRGNLLKVTDALGRIAFTHVYDLKPKSGEGEDEQGANILKTTHIDSGTKTALFDASFKPIELKDAKGAHILHAYDTLNRPTRIWAKDNGNESFTLRQKLIYGDDATDGPATPENTNHLGQLFEHYDEAGLVAVNTYDFKGNVLQKTREVISDAEILSVFDGPPADWQVPTYRVDWEGSPALEGEYISDMEYDAINRVTKLTYPEDVDEERKELVPLYNRAGALETVSLGGNPYVEHIAYNAKGQRLLIAFGNDVMTRYAYDSETFRLTRQRSETFTRSGHTFTPNGTVHQDTGYDYDLSGNILRIKERVNNCGVGGSNSLDRVFNYDPLYRLLNATGRENAPTTTPIWDDSYRSTDHEITTAYTQNYQYDSMGNILQLQHVGNNNFTRNFNYGTGNNNKLQGISAGSDTYSFLYDANGNQMQENTDRHFEWDAADKLRSFRVQAGTSQPSKFAHYLYDAGGNRVKKLFRVSGGNYTSTTYIDGIFEQLTDGTDTQNTLHVMDDMSRIVTIRLGEEFGDTTPAVKYVLEDHLGNSTFEVNGDGTFIAREEYYPFGETSFASYGKKRYKYNGKERDGESGLYNYGMRYYSAWTCRFVSVDPLFRDYAYYTPYQYAGNNPINNVDVDGLEGKDVVDGNSDSTINSNQDSTVSTNGQQSIPDNINIIGQSAPSLGTGDKIEIEEGVFEVIDFEFSSETEASSIRIHLSFTPNEGADVSQNSSEYRWVQTYSTNNRVDFNYKSEYSENTQVDVYDISDRPPHMERTGHITYSNGSMEFEDILNRVPMDFAINWQAETSLIAIDAEGEMTNRLLTVTWGFTVPARGHGIETGGTSTGLIIQPNPSSFHKDVLESNPSSFIERVKTLQIIFPNK